MLSIGKSTILAAYCAHGMVPVTFPGNVPPQPDGFTADQHYLAGTSFHPADAATLERVAAAALAWYAGHRLAMHAAGVRRQMSGPPLG